jgi:hypothetical protein
MTVKISRRSWHYRILRFFGWTPPPTVCGYVWSLLYLLAFGLPVMAFVFVVLSPLILCASVAEHAPKTWFSGVGRRTSLLRQWLRDRKNRMCSLIEYTDTEPDREET